MSAVSIGLLACVLAQGDAARRADPAALPVSPHPAAADLVVEVPDVQALVAAYGSAPLVRLVADEEARKFGAIASEMGLDLGAALAELLDAGAPSTGEAGAGSAGGLSRISISVVGLDRAEGEPTRLRERLGVLAAFVFATPPDAERALSRFTTSALVEHPPAEAPAGEAAATAPASGPGAAARHALRLMGEAVEIWSVREGATLYFGAGRSRAADLAERLARRAPAFEAGTSPAADPAAFSASAGATVLRAWTDVERADPWAEGDEEGAAADEILRTLSPAFLPILGSRGRWRMQLRGDRFVTEGLYERAAGGLRLDRLLGSAPVTPDLARQMPKEAVGGWIATIDHAEIARFLRGILGSRTPEDPASAPVPGDVPKAATGDTPNAAAGDASNAAAGGAANLAAALGDSLAAYLLPFASIQSFVPRVAMSIELKDAALAQRGLEALAAEIHGADPKLALEKRVYHKVTIFTVSRAGAEASGDAEAGASIEGSIKPTVALLPDRLLVTLSPSFARAEVRRLEAKDEQVHALADDGRFPKDAFEAGTMDWAGLLGKLYDAARGLLPMVAQGGGLPFDPAALPAASALTRHFAPSWSWSRRVDGRIHSYSESSFGPETPLAIAATAIAVERSQDSMRAAMSGRTRREKPAGEGASESGEPGGKPAPTPHAVTLGRLREVKTGLAVYRGVKGRAPERLATLLEPTESFPKGFLESADLLKDEWGRDLAYEAQADGSGFKLWSIGPDGVDQRGGGDDLSVP